MTGLFQIMNDQGQAGTVYDVCTKTMGGVGIVLAMIGVIACPITSGDTSFRAARLVIADWFKLDQDSYKVRLAVTLPLLTAGALISQLNYDVVWRYFSWSNQTLAMIALWTIAMYLYKNHRFYWMAAIPATFMSAVSVTYFCFAKECLDLSTAISYPVGIVAALIFLGIFLSKSVFARKDDGLAA